MLGIYILCLKSLYPNKFYLIGIISADALNMSLLLDGNFSIRLDGLARGLNTVFLLSFLFEIFTPIREQVLLKACFC